MEKSSIFKSVFKYVGKIILAIIFSIVMFLLFWPTIFISIYASAQDFSTGKSSFGGDIADNLLMLSICIIVAIIGDGLIIYYWWFA